MPQPTLSLIIPAYNEAPRLPDTLDAVLRFLDDESLNAELIIVDDGSTDTTAALIRQRAARDSRVIAVIAPQNQGKGAAIALGVRHAAGRYIIFFDADLSYPLENIFTALDALERGAQLVIGARDLGERDTRADYNPSRQLATKLFNALVEIALNLGISDTQCGFKAFERRVARDLFDNMQVKRFGFDVELLFLARRWALNLVRIPVNMRDVAGSSVRLGQDSVQMLYDILLIRLRYERGNYPLTRPAVD